MDCVQCSYGCGMETLNQVLDRLEDAHDTSEEALFDAFSKWAEDTGRPLYPHQEEAFLELLEGKHVIAQTPTGSGKSMMALAAHFMSLAHGGRSYYTAPLKALVSEKFFDLVDQFGAANVGMVTGDVSINGDAPIVCCTAEILANQALREGADLDADVIVMDEFHFYGDPQRGWAWQIPLLTLTRPQFLALSATLGDTVALRADLEKRTGREVAEVSDAIRPVPLEFEYCKDDLATTVERLLKEDKAPIYIVHFAQREAVETAKNLEKISLIPKEQKEQISAILKGEVFGRGFGQVLRGLLSKGIGVHHAGMLPKYRRLVERLAQRGLLAVICGTDTLGVGINVPIRTVLFTSLIKFDGRKMRHLSAREFHQIAGRAGRAGFDTIGYVRALASEEEIEKAKRRARMNAAQEAKDKKKLKKLAKSAPKEKGKLTWTEATFDRLVAAAPERLNSQFQVGHALVLNVLRGKDAERRLLKLATDNHEPPTPSNPHLRRLGDIYRSLRQAGVVLRNPELQVIGDLPDDFALNQPLAPFALAAFDLLDAKSDDFALDVLSVVEAVVEDPLPVLYAQQRVARDAAFQAARAQGADYSERQEIVEAATWPKPLDELLSAAFATFARSNPWVGSLEPSPKSVVREIIETASTFTAFVSRYDVSGSEGVILRYLTDVYRSITQILPLQYQTPEVEAIIDWLGNLVRSIDSSLLDEWERLSGNDVASVEVEETAFGGDSDGVNPYAQRRELRNRAFRIVEMIANDNIEGLGRIDPAWPEERWDQALERYYAEHDWVGIDQEARSPSLFSLENSADSGVPSNLDLASTSELSSPSTPASVLDPTSEPNSTSPSNPASPHGSQIITQTILDPAGDLDWKLVLQVAGDNLRVIDFAPM